MTEIGHNNPPSHEAIGLHIDDLYDEAKGFLDGEAIANQGQADAVADLMDKLRKARRDADSFRAEEKRPHDEAAKAVQVKYKPLLDKCDRGVEACRSALSPWLRQIEAERAEEARLARLAADARATEARDKLADPANLAAREEAETLLADAKRADRVASRAEKARPQASGEGRAIGLRTYYEPELIDAKAALRHYMATQPDALKLWLLAQARTDVHTGARNIPGFNIREDRRAA
jgi:hypothetical protein